MKRPNKPAAARGLIVKLPKAQRGRKRQEKIRKWNSGW